VLLYFQTVDPFTYASTISLAGSMTAEVPSSLGEDEIDALLRRESVEFHEVNEAAKRHRRLIDQLPEMPTHRPRNQNLLRAEKTVEWLGSSGL
jgi:hypothetical protein